MYREKKELPDTEWRFSMYILGYPLGLIMRLLYNVLHSYGWSLIIFTLLVKLAMVAAIQPQLM